MGAVEKRSGREVRELKERNKELEVSLERTEARYEQLDRRYDQLEKTALQKRFQQLLKLQVLAPRVSVTINGPGQDVSKPAVDVEGAPGTSRRQVFVVAASAARSFLGCCTLCHALTPCRVGLCRSHHMQGRPIIFQRPMFEVM